MTAPRPRRLVLAVAGSAGTLPSTILTEAQTLGRLAVDAGFRIATGGRDGVMAAVSEGAHQSAAYTEGTVVAVLPTYRLDDANPWVDIAIPTGTGIARNVLLMSMADVVVCVRGGSGTLSEVALAWQLGKPIIALASSGGWAERLAGEALDERRDDRIHRAMTPEQAVALAITLAAEAPRANPIASLDPA
jgi:uncharacterized protein (TIGR00725 family)